MINKKENQSVYVDIPEIAKDILPEPESLNFYKLLDKRIIYVMGEIEAWILEISKMIQLINIEDIGTPVENRKPIKIFIFSEGGEDMSSWNFVDMVAASKTPVWTVNCGVCMSNGLSLLLAGHKRFALRHAVGMYHSGSASLQGTKEQLSAVNKFIASMDKTYDAWFQERCHIDPKLFNRNKKNDWYMTANEMLEYGIVDKIIDTLDEVI